MAKLSRCQITEWKDKLCTINKGGIPLNQKRRFSFVARLIPLGG